MGDSHRALLDGRTKRDRIDRLPSRGRGRDDVNHILNVEGHQGYPSPPLQTPTGSALSAELLQNDVVHASSSTIVPSGTHLMVPEEVNAIVWMDNPRLASFAKPPLNQQPGWQVSPDRPSDMLRVLCPGA